MLMHLRIKNVALISEGEMSFSEGLNILSGETGSGKSMVLDSLHFVLGEKAHRDFLRKGETTAQVEALFHIHSSSFWEKLSAAGILPSEDETVLLSRTMSQAGRSVCRLNGNLVTLAMLKELSEDMLDMHGQHAHQSLLNTARHGGLLDAFCGEDLLQKKEEYKEKYYAVNRLKKELADRTGNEQERLRRLDLLRFQAEEIESAGLSAEEEDILLAQKKRLMNAEKLMRLTQVGLSALYDGDERGESACDRLGEASQAVQELAELDEELLPTKEALEALYAQAEDIAREWKRYAQNIEMDPEGLSEIEERLQLLYLLKRKYGANVAEILNYYQTIQDELTYLEDASQSAEALEQKLLEEEAVQTVLAQEMSTIRQKAAEILEKEIEAQLHELEMKHAQFRIAVEKRQVCTADGADAVEFLIAPNPGEGLKPLARIASGGEMSRVMLALKTVLGEKDSIETFVFDEIDTGVSGRTAQRVGEKMSLIGRMRQVICITHLPQIAAMADSHFLIEKKSAEGKTQTTVTELSDEASIAELARLIGGASITEATLAAAKELKQQAAQWKQ